MVHSDEVRLLESPLKRRPQLSDEGVPHFSTRHHQTPINGHGPYSKVDLIMFLYSVKNNEHRRTQTVYKDDGHYYPRMSGQQMTLHDET